MTDLRSRDLDNLAERTGIRVEFYDPLGTRYGFPTFPYQGAPDGLATLRQLRAAGLRPGGHDPVAQIYWRHRKNRRVAYLYRTDLAAPKRTATPAQREAIAKALLARRTCRHCEQVKPYYIPRRYGCCLDCHGGH
ncbi:RRQRL motif-containing zinc-binding protein [Micromonospora sp. WMMD1155]|uniref:RRQRL motif-containing zinc-binding protein n=1 Tax=Micromonospora sp. WMMD1155 TaxID=3016094 RepID=UPI00249A6F07|nr:RRQRL motif-containing zinc-binding protein [Micromonospora sp. WMMD1155]WFE51458.1 hypothetical protein O7617_14505 [Micromonospora sp. WMMD1155]